MTDNDYGVYSTTQYSASDFDMYNNLMYSGYAGWHWYDVDPLRQTGNTASSTLVLFIYTSIQTSTTERISVNPDLDPNFPEPIPDPKQCSLGYGDSSFMSGFRLFSAIHGRTIRDDWAFRTSTTITVTPLYPESIKLP